VTHATPAARFAGGTDGYFVELNRRRPSADGLDRVSFALCPQAHATDDATVLENLQSLASMAESARALYGQRLLGLSRVTLRPREDPGPDPRQSSFLGAAWTAGLIGSAAAAEFSSLTLYETVGPGGVMDRESVFPVHDVLAEVAGARPGSVAAARASRPDRVLALALRTTGRVRVLAFNLGRTRLVARVMLGKEVARDLVLEPDAPLRIDLNG
jgi:hypothetical protein